MTNNPEATPTWVKVFAIIGLVLVALFAIATVAGVQHGPGMHGALPLVGG